LSSRLNYNDEPEKLDWSNETKLTKEHMKLYNVCTKYDKSDC